MFDTENTHEPHPADDGLAPPGPAVIQEPGGPRPRPPGLEIRFVTRMSRRLASDVTAHARRDGLTAGAWVRRALLDRIGMRSPVDARSGRPVHRPPEEIAAISAAIRELAAVNRAVSASDAAAARAGLDEARRLLIPLVIARAAG
ncbi:hypothetical protein ASF22_19580 [Methylobacterium sp. Leaf87]|uniref:hypothetical protein n=1 Tax=Methylobacterium sp. Leaf87 TaxID=1736243 RepID=UPI0006F5D681|nr:hypothetical protein [Methylobacterium sp. Leaf87]KQO68759.1 hypothetical protein ASF22_19580 [Methylobacterium sp. Leaf87]